MKEENVILMEIWISPSRHRLSLLLLYIRYTVGQSQHRRFFIQSTGEFLVRRRILINDLIDCRWDSFIFFCDTVRTRARRTNEQYVLFRVNNCIWVVCLNGGMPETVAAGIGSSSSASIKIADRLEQSCRINGNVDVDKLSQKHKAFCWHPSDAKCFHTEISQEGWKYVECYRNMIWRKLNHDFQFSFCIEFYSKYMSIFGHVQNIIRFRIFCLLSMRPILRRSVSTVNLSKEIQRSRWHLLGIDSRHWLFGSLDPDGFPVMPQLLRFS